MKVRQPHAFASVLRNRQLDSLRLAVVAGVTVALMARIPTLSQPLVEAHAFRQTQTAYTALWYHRFGTNLFESPLPVLGPPWVVPFEFPLFQGIAAAVMNLGIGPEVSLRATSLAFFAISVVLIYRITSSELGRPTADIATIAFVAAPLGLLWSRTSTIETMAVSISLGSVLGLLHWDRSRSRWALMIAVLLGAAAALVKLTTAFVWLVPAVLVLRRSRAGAFMVLGAAAATGITWTVYTDGIKSMSPATAFLTSSQLRSWTLGSIAERLEPTTWAAFAGWAAGLGLLVVFAPMVAGRSRLGAWAFGTFALGPLVFANLYLVHDYYWMAVGPAAAILTGMVVVRLLGTQSGRALRGAMLLAIFALSFVVYPRWVVMLYRADEEAVLPLAAQVRSETRSDSLVAISGRDWSPALLYYADRRGYMENTGSPPAPDGYIHYICPALGQPGTCSRAGPK